MQGHHLQRLGECHETLCEARDSGIQQVIRFFAQNLIRGCFSSFDVCARSDQREVVLSGQGSEVLAKGTRQSELAQRLSRLASEKGGKKGKGHKGGGECLLESAAKPIEMGSGTEGDGWGKKTAGSGSKKLLVCRAIVQVDDRLLDQVCQLLLLR
jgi:hypothetical protein